MRYLCSLIGLLVAIGPTWAQDKPAAAQPVPPGAATPLIAGPESAAILDLPAVDFNGPPPSWSPRSFLSGNHNFDNFIGFMSNPSQSIDPRAVTELWPVFGSNWVSPYGRLPDGNVQVYGAGLYVALSERLSVGLTQGGYAVADFNRMRQGWLNLGGFAQYTLIEDVPGQFLLTSGMRWEAPSGSNEVFQGHPPYLLAPYLTMGKAFGNVHLLATTGYQFPAGNGNTDTRLFYLNAHLDRQCFGWLYPLVEVNWAEHTTRVDINRPFLNDFLGLDSFSTSGNIVALAAGFNAVLVPSRLEFGAVYTTSLASQANLTFNGLLVKMVMRY